MQPEWWHWVVAGVVLILAELALPAFVLVWFGLGAVLVALFTALMPAASLTTQLGLWLIASVLLVFLWFKVFKPGSHKTRIGTADANVIGEAGLLAHDVAPYEKGEVRFQKPLLGADTWPCIADETIKAGERVRVVSVEGSFLKVAKS